MAGYEYTVVCLANSRKPPAGRCIAGRVFENGRWGGWVRPVSARASRELMNHEREYVSRREPRVLDIMRIPLQEPLPHLHQTENHLIHPVRKPRQAGRVTWAEVERAVEQPDALWSNQHSSSSGLNDRVPFDWLSSCNRSLYLIRPEQLRLVVANEPTPETPLRRRVRASFLYGGTQYRLALTDPLPEKAFVDRPDGEYPVGESLLCISLSEVYQGFAYKLAATVITPRRAGVVR